MPLKLLEFTLSSAEFENINTEPVNKSLFIVFHIRRKHTLTQIDCLQLGLFSRRHMAGK